MAGIGYENAGAAVGLALLRHLEKRLDRPGTLEEVETFVAVGGQRGGKCNLGEHNVLEDLRVVLWGENWIVRHCET